MYKLLHITTVSGQTIKNIVRIYDNAFIPLDESNTDYQVYLKWLSEGNQPLPADEPTEI